MFIHGTNTLLLLGVIYILKKLSSIRPAQNINQACCLVGKVTDCDLDDRNSITDNTNCFPPPYPHRLLGTVHLLSNGDRESRYYSIRSVKQTPHFYVVSRMTKRRAILNLLNASLWPGACMKPTFKQSRYIHLIFRRQKFRFFL